MWTLDKKIIKIKKKQKNKKMYWTREKVLEWLAKRGVITYPDLSAFEVFAVIGNKLLARVKSKNEVAKLAIIGKKTENELIEQHWDKNEFFFEHRKYGYVVQVGLYDHSDGLEAQCWLTKNIFNERLRKNNIIKIVPYLNKNGHKRLLDEIDSLDPEQYFRHGKKPEF